MPRHCPSYHNAPPTDVEAASTALILAEIDEIRAMTMQAIALHASLRDMRRQVAEIRRALRIWRA